MQYSNIVVYYDGREAAGGDAGERSMGVCVSMSGNGCRVYEEDSGRTLLELCAELLAMHDWDDKSVNFSRIDIACDDKTGALKIQRMLDYLDARQVNTRLRKACRYDSFDLGQPKGLDDIGFYIGAATSDFRYRIYDKAKEQGDYESHWIRVEMVNRKGYALGAVRALVEAKDELGHCVAGMIRASLLFIEADNARIERCSVAEWWDDFLETLEAVKYFERIKAVQNADKLYFWFEGQLSRSFAMAKLMFGDSFLDHVFGEGKIRLSSAQRTMVADYIERQSDKDQLTFEDYVPDNPLTPDYLLSDDDEI